MRITVSGRLTGGFGQEQVDAEHQPDLGPLIKYDLASAISSADQRNNTAILSSPHLSVDGDPKVIRTSTIQALQGDRGEEPADGPPKVVHRQEEPADVDRGQFRDITRDREFCNKTRKDPSVSAHLEYTHAHPRSRGMTPPSLKRK
jgi:hypothetical protein